MIKILLCCVAGMSTSLLVTKIKKAAEAENIECEVSAVAIDQLKSNIEGVNVVLLGPQIKYKLPEVKKICDEKNIPCDVINMVDYGLMNGKKVLDFCMKMAK
ncbi:PTS sugar transporter subunit IIB [Acerihabitans sp. TG2]|uniref:PTS sugar transporter subunit IIB n=1 Tax=Acerihabitans sp. TG2 TaxID=3096008 RepID=UPI002B23B934|nr:PTS sugar transporter subunit IIB [Acerihabitans sp. TG2]MEA9390239.1 PTS sugar transporter subunit IIB [Acerihabitans sp. TG2]